MEVRAKKRLACCLQLGTLQCLIYLVQLRRTTTLSAFFKAFHLLRQGTEQTAMSGEQLLLLLLKSILLSTKGDTLSQHLPASIDLEPAIRGIRTMDELIQVCQQPGEAFGRLVEGNLELALTAAISSQSLSQFVPEDLQEKVTAKDIIKLAKALKNHSLISWTTPWATIESLRKWLADPAALTLSLIQRVHGEQVQPEAQ
ncbi:unnamed protein product [Symbiodinium natans]|uniref:Uncharacterized protein n=1 Tax=Symbiodinium natans TaxID=878477 RepID=A0A812K832_9DINO|nr:unnamed protein product [Symbiodinium natans]